MENIVVLLHGVKSQFKPAKPCITSNMWGVAWWHLRSTVFTTPRCTRISYTHLYMQQPATRGKKEQKGGRKTGQRWKGSFASHLTEVSYAVMIFSALPLKVSSEDLSTLFLSPVISQPTYAGISFLFGFCHWAHFQFHSCCTNDRNVPPRAAPSLVIRLSTGGHRTWFSNFTMFLLQQFLLV